MQDIFQEFISFLLNSWKSLIFLFVFSFLLKETIGRVVLFVFRILVHIILDLSDKTVSPFYSNKNWGFSLSSFMRYSNWEKIAIKLIDYHVSFHGPTDLNLVLEQKITNKKIRAKYFNLIDSYLFFYERNFAFALIFYSGFYKKIFKKAIKNHDYIKNRKYKNEFTQITFLLIHKLKLFYFKIYVFIKAINVLKELELLHNFKYVMKKNINHKEFNLSNNLEFISPVIDLELLYDVYQYSLYQKELNSPYSEQNGLLFSDMALSGVSDAQELANRINESDFLRDMKFDVILSNDEKKLLDTNYQVIKSPNYSEHSWIYSEILVWEFIMVELKKTVEWGDEWLCPDSQELMYEYRFVSNVQIEKVIQLIDYHKGELNIYISKGNIEESLKKHLNEKRIGLEKNYYYISRVQNLQRKINNAFKYIDYTFILIWFIISIFIEQNYFVLLETSSSSLLEFLKYYFLINHLI